jgi:hypothetical protein
VFDLDLHQIGVLDAPYPTNVPWPTLVPTPRGMLMVCFDGTPTGGRLPGYGTHGAVIIAREVERSGGPRTDHEGPQRVSRSE